MSTSSVFMKNKLFAIFILAVFMLLSSGYPEKNIDNNAVPGKIILQLRQTSNQKAALSDLEGSYFNAGLKSEKCLSEQLGIWLFSYDGDAGRGQYLLWQLRNDQLIAQAQFDHYISLRELIPDDPMFMEQWALYNIGQSGGVVDADIDATEAWEIAVNTGTTVLGDTIVLAVIDDGFSLEHEDMNYWKNHHEIPDNGIDDDNNGYIDDYDGWNAYSSTGNIPVRDHGTHVAGIAGAVGNNGLGVSGVNWNCKIMPVAGSSNFESFVVEAYAYVYKMRSLYEETNGEKGAYVIATNSSFGVDFANPDDYPIWGMMYDSLGSLGILSAAATMNKPWNVEEMGDVPTNFTSDFLIGVTNTTKNDIKYNGAAWGPVSIDLGAPGTSIVSTKLANSYGYKTGTSMCAPMVSGSVALMFAAADETFLQAYNEQPDIIAVFLKNLILDGVDTLAGFDTLCVSGGRLNVNNAINKMLNPRIQASADTLRYLIAPDSLGQTDLVLHNLLGFELPFTCIIESMPGWVDFNPASGVLAGNDSIAITFSFDAGGMALGTYFCEMFIEDIAGMKVTVVIEMDVIPDMGISDAIAASKVITSYYPNPFSNELYLCVCVPGAGDLQLSVYSLSGNLFHSWNERIAWPGEQTISWDGMDKNGNMLPAGIYIIQISGKGFIDRVKVLRSAN